jgi:hypothetical protein
MTDKPSHSSHVFEGAPDARQAGDIAPSRFRPRYRALSDAEKALHDQIKAKAEELEVLYWQIDVRPVGKAMAASPSGRHRALAVTALEESVMWAVKELTA